MRHEAGRRFFFFFQADDGIRDFSLSRGRGDGYRSAVLDMYVCVCVCVYIRGVWQINLEPRFEKIGLLGPQDNGSLNEPNHVPYKPS